MHGVQDKPRFTSKPVKLVHQQLIELPEPGVSQNLTALRSLIQRDGPGDPVIGIDSEDWQLVESAEAITEFVLRFDGLALALLFGRNAGINGYWHNRSSVLEVIYSPRHGWLCRSPNASLQSISPPPDRPPPPADSKALRAVARGPRPVAPRNRPERYRP